MTHKLVLLLESVNRGELFGDNWLINVFFYCIMLWLFCPFRENFQAENDVVVRRMATGSPRRVRIQLQIFPDRQRREV